MLLRIFRYGFWAWFSSWAVTIVVGMLVYSYEYPASMAKGFSPEQAFQWASGWGVLFGLIAGCIVSIAIRTFIEHERQEARLQKYKAERKKLLATKKHQKREKTLGVELCRNLDAATARREKSRTEKEDESS